MKKVLSVLAALGLLVLIGCGDSGGLGPADGMTKGSDFELAASAQSSVNTKIVKKPANPSNSTAGKFSFNCTAASCTFKCSLDSAAWKSCSSPKSYKSLSAGAHTFKVKASSNGKSDRTPATYSWNIEYWLPTAAGPLEGREQGVVVWTGSEMIIWSGLGMASGFVYYGNGARYNPVSGSWIAMSSDNAPAARFRSASVWAGVKMIVWSGYLHTEADVFTDTGGIYDPASNSWSPMSTTNAPSGRGLHTAIWTGADMIVWGGVNGANTGGKYNLAGDSWTATSTINAPAYRYYHTAVNTGTYMIIWGGNDNSVSFNDGGRYLISGNSWAAVSTVNAPIARYEHTAVWTGEKMIVWGGDVSGFTDNGGIYDPGLDSWTETSTTNIPEARYGHVAIWTGTEMLVWGGYGSTSNCISSGGRYNPIGNSWSAMSALNAPAGREHAAVVDTESSMIIWGGVGSGGYRLNTGGRYFY